MDIITGGSPCQDLSIAGKRAGLAGERSGLFMEQIRVIKEMREHERASGRADNDIRPRFMVWENVPGAFSSNQGEDFRAVLEETAKIADSNAFIPKPPKGKWTHAGCIMGDGWSIAWRVHDAQFWGVPQRRKRISLVADFAGGAAPEILFEREGLSRDTTESREKGQGTTRDSERCTGETGRVASTITATYGTKWNGNAGAYNGGNFVIQKQWQGTIADTERSVGETSESIGVDIFNLKETGEKVVSLIASGNSSTGTSPKVITNESLSFQERAGKEGKVTILNPSDSQGNQVADSDGIYPTLRGCGGAGYQQGYLFEHKNSTAVFGISSYNSNAMKSSNPHSGIYEAETTRTLDNNGGNPACNQGGMAVVYTTQASGDRNNPSQSYQEEKAYTIPSNPMSDRGQAGAYIKQSECYSNYKADGAEGNGVAFATVGDHENRSTDMTNLIVKSSSWNGSQASSRTHPVVVEGFDSYNISLSGEKGKTLQSEGGGTGVNEGCVLIENYPNDSRVKIREDRKVQTLSSKMSTDGGNVPLVFGRQHDVTANDITPSLCAKMGTGGNNVPMVMEEPYNATTGSYMRAGNSGVAETLMARDCKDPQIVCNSVVRRLTPLECERLQGYPDGWTDIGEWYDSKGKKHKDADSPRYKALGNSIALPFWQWMAERMVKYISHESTMASLFDGIGGFPLVYSRVGCQPIWASEIEEFPMAVTKKHFGDDDLGLEGDCEQS